MQKISGFLVAIFYPFIVAFTILLLAAVQLRASGGAAYDTWKLNYSANRILAPQLDAMNKALRLDVYKNLDDLNFADLCLKLYDSDGKLIPGIDQEVLDEAKTARKDGKNPNDFRSDLGCVLKGYIVLQYDKLYFDTKKKDLAKDLVDLQTKIALNNDQYTELIKGHQEFLAFNEMEQGPWFSSLVVFIPYHLMVLLLVMFMGSLGGMVRILRDYGDPSRRDPSAADYFFIPLIGLVVAIGGYVLARTGLLLLSSAKEDTSLSPFMIGLVGLISGLLAKDVIDAIARAGTKMVNNQQAAQGAQPGGGNNNAAP